jgi:hypothetical protein
VFAVDQTVQRSPDGSEERTIAKTVSLMLLPEQANKLSLAEQIGEISLIPRNPDDQEAETWSEVTIDDLLADGEVNSREKEQGRDEAEEEPQTDEPSQDLLSIVQNAAPPAKPPFRMEIVEAQDIREVLFDADTGKPIRNMVEQSASGPRVTPATPASYPNKDTQSRDAESLLDDFPIDFAPKK